MRKQIIKNRIYKCIGPSITPQKIQNLQKDLRANNYLSNSIGLYEILAGEMRSQIIYLLSKEGWLCVCDLADILQTSVSAVSHQLAVLRKAGLVRFKKENKVVFYTLEFNLPESVKILIKESKKLSSQRSLFGTTPVASL